MKITIPQRKALENLVANRSSYYGLRTSAEHGGHASVLDALMRRNWIEWVPDKGHRITKEGREALKP